MTYIKRIVLGLLVSFGILVLAIVAINAIDDELRPELQKIVNSEPVLNDRQLLAYQYVLGLHAGNEDEPEAKGRDLWQTLQAKPAHERDEYFRANVMTVKDLWSGQDYYCQSKPKGRQCNSADITPELEEKLIQDKTSIDRYLQLIEFGEIGYGFIGSNFLGAQVRFMPLKTHKALLTQMSLWLKRGGDARVLDTIEKSNRYLKSVMQNGTLLDRMIAIVCMSGNMEFVVAESELNPKFARKVGAQTLDTFSTPDIDTIFFGALETELRMLMPMFKKFRSLGDIQASSLGTTSEHTIKDAIPITPFLRKNESLNKYYEIATQALTADCDAVPRDKLEELCMPALEWASLDSPWHWVSNPIGRALVKVTSPMWANQKVRTKERLKKLYDQRELLSRSE